MMENGYKGIAVISGEGVKGYYRKNGYFDEDTFMIKDFSLYMIIINIIIKNIFDLIKNIYVFN